MSEFFFGLHDGHLKARANDIAVKYGAWHVNYTEPRGEKRGWFACPNRGQPFDDNTANTVMAAIDREGGLKALTRK